jgi:hypothetical protein
LLALGCPDERGVRTPAPVVFFPCYFARPRRAHAALNITNIEKGGKGGGCLAGTGRRHQGETAECDEGVATPDLLLKRSDATLTTYI